MRFVLTQKKSNILDIGFFCVMSLLFVTILKNIGGKRGGLADIAARQML